MLLLLQTYGLQAWVYGFNIFAHDISIIGKGAEHILTAEARQGFNNNNRGRESVEKAAIDPAFNPKVG